MKRKLTTLLLAVCLVATMMPAYTGVAFAVGEPTAEIKLGGDTVLTLHVGDSYSNNGFSANFIGAENLKIVLDNVNINGGVNEGISITVYDNVTYMANTNVDIELKGKNKVSGTYGISIGAYGGRSVSSSFHGAGNLEVLANQSFNAYGLYCQGSMTINSGQISATAVGNTETDSKMPIGIYAQGSLSFNGGTVHASATNTSGACFGLCSYPSGNGGTKVDGGAVYASGKGTSGSALGTYDADIATIAGLKTSGGDSITGYTPAKNVSIITKNDSAAGTYTPVCVYAGDTKPATEDGHLRLSVGPIPAYGFNNGWNSVATGAGISYGDFSSTGAYTWKYESTEEEIKNIPTEVLSLTCNDLVINTGLGEKNKCGIYAWTLDGEPLLLRVSGNLSVKGPVPKKWSESSYGIYVKSADIEITDGNITATGGDAGKESIGIRGLHLTIKGGTVNAAGGEAYDGSFGMSSNKIVVNGGDITAVGGEAIKEHEGVIRSHGIYLSDTDNETIAINGGTVYAYSIGSALNDAPEINFISGTSEVLTAATSSGALQRVYDSANVLTYKQMKIQQVQPHSSDSTYRPSKPTVTTVTDLADEVGGATEYNPATKTLKVIPAEGFVIEDVLVNGVPMGAKGEISPIYGWDKVQVKFVKDANAKIEAGVKATTLKIGNIKSYKYKGKNRIKLTWKKSKGYKVDYYRIYRAVGDGEFKLFYTTKTNKCTYVNTKNVKSGVQYKFKIAGVRTLDGEEVMTRLSKWRSAVGK